MDLRSQLPKIGTEIYGQVCLGDDEFKIFCGSRPDYEKFKTGYATESECVEALIGIGFPPEVIEKLLKKQWDKATEKAPDKTIDSDHPAFVRYVEVTRLFHEIMTDIDIGIAEGKVRVVLDYEGQSEVKSDWKYWKFSGLNILDTDTFFSWMHERGYPVPDELAIQKEKRPKQKVMLTPPKTQWHQIHFRIVNPTRIEITTPDGMEPYHPDDLGFTLKIWDLFERFSAEGVEYIGEEKHDIARLRKLLRTVFPGVEGDPIPHEKAKGYRAEFHITEA